MLDLKNIRVQFKKRNNALSFAAYVYGSVAGCKTRHTFGSSLLWGVNLKSGKRYVKGGYTCE